MSATAAQARKALLFRPEPPFSGVRLAAAHHSARTSEFSGGHQACGARADEMMCFACRRAHTGALPTRPFGIRVPDAVPQ
jgi:hypothetical protein